MKKFLLIGLIVALAFIVVGGAGVVFAQVQGNAQGATVTVTTTQNGDEIQQFGYGPGGMMGGSVNQYGPGQGGMMGGDGRGGMMGGNNRGGMMGGRAMGLGAGVMRGYIVSAFADAVGLTVNDVNTSLANGETLAQIAIAQGKTQADLPALWTQVRQDALNKAVADGVITQAQADMMLQRMKNSSGPGLGGCPMFDGNETQP